MLCLYFRYSDGSNRMMGDRAARRLIKAFREDTAGPLVTGLVASGCTLETMGGQHLESPQCTADTLEREARGVFSATEGGAA